MKHFLVVLCCLFCGYLGFLRADEVYIQQYQDSTFCELNKVTNSLGKLTFLRELVYQHQYAPFDKTFSKWLYREAQAQKKIFYQNLGAYYLAACYDRQHEADSLQHWVNILEQLAPQVGTYDYFLEQKAALSRALTSNNLVEKAIFCAEEVLNGAQSQHSINGEIAAYNSLGCAYVVSTRISEEEALEVFLKAYSMFTPQVGVNLRLDILSRIIRVHENIGKEELVLPYLEQMDELLKDVVAQEPELRRNWTHSEIDCAVKYVNYYLSQGKNELALQHIDRAKLLLDKRSDLILWINVQFAQLRYYRQTKEYAKSIQLIDELTPLLLTHKKSYLSRIVTYKSEIQNSMGEVSASIETLQYLINIQDSLNALFSATQLQQLKEIYNIDDLLIEKQKIRSTNYKRAFSLILLLLIVMFIFFIYTRTISRKIVAAEKITAEAALCVEKENESKNRLQTEISHDIRTPLNPVVGFAELLMEAENLDSNTKKEYGYIIQENAEKLLEYVNSILELSRLESGKTKYKEEECELIALCQEIVKGTNKMRHSDTKVSLKTSIETQVVCTDKTAFLSLLTHLLKPAINTPYQITLCIVKEKSKLKFDFLGSSLAKIYQENKDTVIRHEIHAHLIHHFGGEYITRMNAAEDEPVVSFTYPLKRN